LNTSQANQARIASAVASLPHQTSLPRRRRRRGAAVNPPALGQTVSSGGGGSRTVTLNRLNACLIPGLAEPTYRVQVNIYPPLVSLINLFER
jgi:hypothetical protein